MFLLTLFPGAVSQTESPGKTKGYHSNILFTIERSRDIDKVYYEINLNDDERLNEQEPIKAYWVRHTRNNQIEPLTRIQKKISYGLLFSDVTPYSASFQFASFSEREFKLKKTPQGIFRVYTQSANQLLEVQKMFIEFEGGTYLMPKIGRVDLYLIDTNTGKTVIEAFEP